MQLHAVDITHSHGATVVLDRVSLTVSSGDRIGLVGPNGVGKSTLLRLLAGIEPVQSGRIWGAPPGLAAGMLPQELDVRPGETLRAYLERRTGVAAAAARMDRLAADLAEHPERSQEYSDALEAFLARGGADLEARAAAVCDELGLGRRRLDQPLHSLSGGEGARARLAAAAARAVRRAAARRADERPRPGRAGAAGAVPRPDAGRRRDRHPRPGAARAARRDASSSWTSSPAGPPSYAGGWAGVPSGAGDRPPRRLGGVSRLRRGAGAGSRRELRTPPASGRARASQRAKTPAHRQRTSHRWHAAARRAPRSSAAGAGADRAPDRAARTGRQAARAVAAADRPVAGAPARRDVVARLRGRRRRARRRSRSGRSTSRSAGATGSRSLGRNGSGKSTLLAALLGALPLAAGERVARAVGASSARSTRPASRFARPRRAAARRVPAARAGLADGRGPHAAGQVRPGRRRTSPRPAGTLSPGERTRAALALLQARGRRTCWCSTSPPTTSTCRRSSSWSRRWPPTRAPCCWSPTTAASWNAWSPTASSPCRTPP